MASTLAAAGEAKVHLHDKEYVVVAQTKAYLRRKLPKAFDLSAFTADEVTDVDSLLALVDERAYRLLAMFIPELMPEYEFNGFATEEAFAADEYDEKYDRAPSIPQVRNAIEVCAEVNGLDLVKHLKNLVSPELIRAFMVDAAVTFRDRLQTTTSANSSSPLTPRTPSTTSGTNGKTPPTPESEDSPSPDLSPSSTAAATVEPENSLS